MKSLALSMSLQMPAVEEVGSPGDFQNADYLSLLSIFHFPPSTHTHTHTTTHTPHTLDIPRMQYVRHCPMWLTEPGLCSYPPTSLIRCQDLGPTLKCQDPPDKTPQLSQAQAYTKPDIIIYCSLPPPQPRGYGDRIGARQAFTARLSWDDVCLCVCVCVEWRGGGVRVEGYSVCSQPVKAPSSRIRSPLCVCVCLCVLFVWYGYLFPLFTFRQHQLTREAMTEPNPRLGVEMRGWRS